MRFCPQGAGNNNNPRARGNIVVCQTKNFFQLMRVVQYGGVNDHLGVEGAITGNQAHEVPVEKNAKDNQRNFVQTVVTCVEKATNFFTANV